MANVIKTAVEFLQRVKEGDFVLIKFVKKDGTDRIMKATLNFLKIPNDKKPKGVDLVKILKLLQNSKMLRVFDIEKMDWRTVPFESVEWLKTLDKQRKITTYTIEKRIKE